MMSDEVKTEHVVVDKSNIWLTILYNPTHPNSDSLMSSNPRVPRFRHFSVAPSQANEMIIDGRWATVARVLVGITQDRTLFSVIVATSIMCRQTRWRQCTSVSSERSMSTWIDCDITGQHSVMHARSGMPRTCFDTKD